MDRIFDVAGLIVILAMVAVIVGSKNTQAQITALGSAFSNSIWTATHPGV